VPLSKVTLSLFGHDVTYATVSDAAGHTMRGVVTRLVNGPNDLRADANGNGNGGRAAE